MVLTFTSVRDDDGFKYENTTFEQFEQRQISTNSDLDTLELCVYENKAKYLQKLQSSHSLNIKVVTELCTKVLPYFEYISFLLTFLLQENAFEPLPQFVIKIINEMRLMLTAIFEPISILTVQNQVIHIKDKN